MRFSLDGPIFDIDNKMLFEDFDGITKRNIVIILCQGEKRANGKFLKIVGIDVFTGKMVNIVDTNGSKYGFHSYTKEFSELSVNMAMQLEFKITTNVFYVIQAEFKTYANEFHLNTLRIVSPFRVLGKTNLLKLRRKYKQVSVGIPDFVCSFKDVFDFCWKYKNSRSYCIVNFTGSRVKLHKNKIQLKMSGFFVNIWDEKLDFNQIQNMYYYGWTTLQCDVGADGKCRFSARRLHGKFLFLSEEEFEGRRGKYRNSNDNGYGELAETYEEYNDDI